MSYKLDACSPSEKIENGLVCQAHVVSSIYHNQLWFLPLGPLGPEGVLSSSVGYYTNMVQQITFIIYANINAIT